MDTVKDAEEMSLLSKQKTTHSPHGVFDASQFKKQVDRDVSSDVIERLQNEFGHDLAGAIDKFLDEDQKSSEAHESKEEKNQKSSEKTEQGENESNTDSLGRKPFVIRDRYWDKFKRQHVLQKPNKSKGESKKHKRCVIFVRRDYSEDMTSFTTALVISGATLRNALRNIFRGTDGFGLTEDESTEVDPTFMYWARPELEILAEHYRSIKDDTAVFEMDSAFKFIESEYKDMISVLPSLVPHSITFQYLWALLPPDCLVVGKDSLDFDSIWSVRSHAVERMQDGVFLVLNAEHIIWDGVKAGNVKQTLRIPIFGGLMLIRDLPYVPLKYHPQQEAIVQQVLKRSAKALRYWKPTFSHQEHQGTGLAEVYDRVEKYPFSGRAVVDPAMMRQMKPANKIMPRSRDISNLRNISRVCLSELAADTQESEILEELLKDASKALLENVDGSTPQDGRSDDDSYTYYSDDSASEASLTTPRQRGTATKEVQLTKQQMLLVSGLLYGYSLREGTWGAFAVDRVSDITWNRTIFDSLVMEKTIKDVIYQLVVAHGVGASDFDDFVKGKGKGFVGLLFGPPGSGKTLTAEAIAETAQMPLYSVSSGALGHEASKIHDRLSKILKLAGHWKAVLLLDEADVFLAQRTTTDIERNAIVSVFLRELEYYQGILLLTTNQAEVIDEAFQSRIHLSLQYPSLDTAARLKIWENFMANARQYKSIKVDVGQSDLRILAETPLNGRQIKNTISIAVKIAATSEPHTITASSLKDTARLLQSSQFPREPKTFNQDVAASLLMNDNLSASKNTQMPAREVVNPLPNVLTTLLPGLTGICFGVLGTLWLLRNGSLGHVPS
ncbi:P-loop containing nucleoside triphosphate hydrolase protein [Hypoxylon rubiginosum]|uniref:P-loop containing nucleoside triphosphate hydrolase protein n=1 Tax=Hypoxylon rubiginosum TaxID=110542 RepID=A0ACC0DBN3_9PEZI|nr:P-loop containing nucleoside triphosphate hydrolase protein [Hypoxylon rubiginosum]